MARRRGTFGQRELADVSPAMRVLEKERGDLADYVLSGRCADFPEYRSKTGQIKGLNMAIEQIEASLRRARGVDPDDDEEEG